MAVLVQKFGGTSVANINRLKEVSRIIVAEIERGNLVIAVVSAMAGVTNRLVTLCNEISSEKNIKSTQYNGERDVALASGEIVTSSLLSLCLIELGYKAKSFLCWQLPIITDNNYGGALVKSIDSSCLTDCLNQGIIPVVAGFQGVTEDYRLTTLGRGGSDTTASLIGASVKADLCEIYTDVEGIFTADPRIVHEAQRLEQISFKEMLEFASAGAKVLHPRSVEVAMRYNIPIRVLSSFSKGLGTLVTSEENIMEERLITGIACNRNLLKISIKYCDDNFDKIYDLVVSNNINIELMLNVDGFFTIITQVTNKTLIESFFYEANLKFETMVNISLISIVGYGIKHDNKLTQTILSVLGNNKIPVMMMHNSEIKISILVDDSNTEKSIKLLHHELIARG